MSRIIILLLLFSVLIASSGCGPSVAGDLTVQSGTPVSSGASVQTAASEKRSDRTPSANAAGTSTVQVDEERLAQLKAERSKDQFAPSFSLGPGDVIKISVEDVPDLKDEEVRVAPDDSIALPDVGTVKVGGLKEAELKQELTKDFGKYIKDPQIDLFVKEYHSRQAAVIGMVQKPGLYTINSRDDTLLDILSQAGGMAESAGSQIIFIPSSGKTSQLDQALRIARAGRPQDLQQLPPTSSNPSVASQPEQPGRVVPIKLSSPSQLDTGDDSATVIDGTDPIVISLSRMNKDSRIDVPARPGDVIMVPAAGEVMVQGWVQNPGAFKVTSGMTAFGAITAAGGQMFSSSATILRHGSNGRHFEIPVDLAAVKAGQQPDVPMQGGDVIIVNRSVTGAVPYAFYEIFTKMTGGAFVPMPVP